MAESNVAAAPKETQQSAKPTRQGSLLSRVAYSFGNVGQSAFYNALSTYFIVYVTSSLFSGVDKALATKLIGVITGLVVVIRIAEIFIDPLLGNIVNNTEKAERNSGRSLVQSDRQCNNRSAVPPFCSCWSTPACSAW